MRIAKIALADGRQRVALVEDEQLQLLDLAPTGNFRNLADILHAADPSATVRSLLDPHTVIPASQATFLAPIDQQEVWAAGVTYRRSQAARMEESKSGASHYDRVYTADRPELFLKATPGRVSGPGQIVRVRADSSWCVPEPELTLVITPDLRLAGFTVGNDMSARDIEGENPLYLPQAKVYDQCCALGPCVLLAEEPLDRAGTKIVLTIERDDSPVFHSETALDQMARSFQDLIDWLGRENSFPDGVFLLTGTGIVPPDDFTLKNADTVSIEITGIGRLTNPVVQQEPP